MMNIVQLLPSFILLLFVLVVWIQNNPITVDAFFVNPNTKLSSTTTPAFTINSLTQLSASALIIQNKGGGHGELGYQLAKHLLETNQVTEITIVQDQDCKRDKEPFVSYSTDLPSVEVIYAPVGDDTAIPDAQTLQSTILGIGRTYDYVWDNASKSNVGFGKAIIDCARTWDTLKLYCYISSAGVYNPSKTHGRTPLLEYNTPIKESAGQILYDQYAISNNLPYVSFRPQYIYGPKSNKFDYIDYFFDRLVRGLPIPIPQDGNQLVSLTNSEDVATLLASPLHNINVAIEQRYFNCGTDQLISYKDLAYACADVAGIPRFNVKIEYFDYDALGTKGVFPFRMTDFFVVPDIAQQKLNWIGPKHTIHDDLIWYYQDYKNNRRGHEKKISLIKDWEIVVGCKTSPPEYVSSIYEKYDPIILESYEPTN